MKRIQRKRTKGWRMPQNAVFVGRPSLFGNPFRDIKDIVYYFSDRRNRQRIDPWVYYGMKTDEVNAIDLYKIGIEDPAKIRNLITGYDGLLMERKFIAMKARLHELKGKDLACWCNLDKPCHADILLKYAN